MIQEKPLEQLRVLNTRPVHQANALSNALKALGAQVLSLPAIEIKAIEQSLDTRLEKASQAGWMTRLHGFDYVIFISPNAVEYGTALILAQGNIPDKLMLVTIGKASADKLFQCTGRKPDIFPVEDFSSEALLALPAMHQQTVTGKHILIIRGHGGREYLADTLRQRGANVEYAEVYQRCLPQVDSITLENIWGFDPPHIVTITSAEGLKNLLQLSGPRYRHLLLNTPLVVVRQSMVPLARDLGFINDILVAGKASNQALIDAVIQWRSAFTSR